MEGRALSWGWSNAGVSQWESCVVTHESNDITRHARIQNA